MFAQLHKPTKNDVRNYLSVKAVKRKEMLNEKSLLPVASPSRFIFYP